MTRLSLARLILYFTGMVAVLNIMGVYPILTYLLPVLLLGLFINVVKIQYDVLVLGKNLNESYTFLRTSKLYQMEVET